MSASTNRRKQPRVVAASASGNRAVEGLFRAYLLRAMESLWLLAAGLVPLLFAPPDFMVFPDVLKVVVLRSLVALMAVAWAVEWALVGPGPAALGSVANPRRWLQWAGDSPRHRIIAAGTLFIAATGISTLASESGGVSLWGSNPGRDGYGFFNAASYYVLFLVVATHVKSTPQVWRLLGAITFAASVASLYGVLQHFGADPFLAARPVRITSSFGNALFAASFLVLALPATLALATVHLRQKRPLWAVTGWSAVTVVQLLAIMYTLSRGPWLALAAGALVWLGLVASGAGRRHVVGAAALAGLATAIALGLALAAPGGIDDSGLVAPSPLERASTISGEVASGGLSGRLSIWERSVSLIAQRPWLEESGALSSVSRHLFGYGPDLFVSALPLKWSDDALAPVNASAHNYPLQVAVELGLLGLASYVVLVGVLVATLLRGIRRGATPDLQWWLVYAALAAAVAIRLIEQMSGVARVSDHCAVLGAYGARRGASGGPTPHKSDFSEEARQEQPGQAHRRRSPMGSGADGGRPGRWPILGEEPPVRPSGRRRFGFFAGGAPGRPAGKPLADGPRHIHRAGRRALPHDAGAAHVGVRGTGRHRPRPDSDGAAHVQPAGPRTQLPVAHRDAGHGHLSRRVGAARPSGIRAEAVELYTRLTLMLPGYETVYNDLASTYLIVGDPLGALGALERYVEATGGTVKPSAKSLYIRGVAFDELGRSRDAVASLEGYISDSPDGRYVEFANRRLSTLYDGLGGGEAPEENATAAEDPRP